jgi:acetoin utilization deacetylase AcuC-like enzyme
MPARTSGKTYLSELKNILPAALDKLKPELIFYNADSDVLASNPLSTLRLSVDDMTERDLFVTASARERTIC